MDNNKIVLYTLAGFTTAYLVKKYFDSKKEFQNFNVLNEIVRPEQHRDINELNRIKSDVQEIEEGFESIEYKDVNEYVYTLKKIINYFYEEEYVVEDDIYDGILLETVQDLFKKSPALIDYNSGKICVNFIRVMDYIIKKTRGQSVYDIVFETMPDINVCEVVEKGDTGYKVMELQRFVNHVLDENALMVNGNYSSNMKTIVKSVFGNTNVIRQDASSGVCYRFLKSASIMFKNIDRNIQDYEDELEGKNSSEQKKEE